MRVYIDSSALVKRSVDEAESDALEDALDRMAADGHDLFSSALAVVEVSRVIRSRRDAEPPASVVAATDRALAGISIVPLDEQMVGLARRLGPASLRSLDAIHLSSAALLDADLVCAYDARLLTAAEELGFATISPA